MSKRELIDTGTDKRYIRRDSQGRFKGSDDVGKSLATDRRTITNTTVKSGQGERGDQKKGSSSGRFLSAENLGKPVTKVASITEAQARRAIDTYRAKTK